MIKTIGRMAVTAVVVVVAAVVAWNLWIYYEQAPRTRDGRLRANVVTIATDVAGHVLDVDVRDDQTVKKGDVLFRLDPERYRIALQEADASASDTKATLVQAKNNFERYKKLGTFASVQQREQAGTEVVKAQAAYQKAEAALDRAKLDLERTTIRSPVNGSVTNLGLQAGDYVTVGSPIMAIVDSDSFYAVGYFEETKLARIKVGDAARITIMGEDGALSGHVSGVAAAITDSDHAGNTGLLANVNPSFNWVRLAQRIPVRIAIDQAPPSVRLVAGRTVSIDIIHDGSE